MGDGLMKRLKAKVEVAQSTKGPVKRLRNPDGPEAASRIAELGAKLATADEEVERWHSAYNIAHDQATANGAKLATAVGMLTRFMPYRNDDYVPNVLFADAEAVIASIQERT